MPARVRGFTLIELMVTIAVLAVIVALATPSFAGIINSNRLATASNELLTSLQLARMEAVRRNAPVVVCASENAESASPSCTAGDWGQWVTFVDLDGNRQVSSGESLLRVSALDSRLEVTSDSAVSGSVMFASDGLAYTATGALVDGAVAICIPTSTPRENVRTVSISFGSSVSIETDGPNEDCSDSP